MYLVGFYSVPNLIVIIFNLLYPVFIMGFDCKGCMLERENVCEDSSNWSQKSSCGYLVTKLPVKWSMCLVHDWNAKSQYRWRQLCLVSISRVRPSRETPAKHNYLHLYWLFAFQSCARHLRDTRETFCSTRLYYLIYTFCTYTIYTHITYKWCKELLRENLAKTLKS